MTAQEIIKEILELFKSLFAPAELSYIPLTQNSSDTIYQDQIIKENQSCLLVEHREQIFGILKINGSIEKKMHSASLFQGIAKLLGITISNLCIGEEIELTKDALQKENSLLKKSLQKKNDEFRFMEENLIREKKKRRQIVESLEKEKRRNISLLGNLQKSESIDLLAGGIAHDFNNLLVAILGGLSLLKLQKNNDEQGNDIISKIEKATIQAKELSQQLLNFSTKGTLIKKPASLHEVISNTAYFILRGSEVKCELCIPDSLWPVEIDKVKMNRVIDNLIINAEQAMPNGGIITIEAQNHIIEEKNTLSLTKGKYVKVCIKDQGAGIPSANIPKIFNPYFTTKKEGNGLGLAFCHSIIKQHGGAILAQSQKGKGTCFSIFLPSAHQELLIPDDAIEEQFFFGQGKILFMDDDKAVRDIAQKILLYLGYQVEFAKNGSEAIELFKKAINSGKFFDAVILDLTIPGEMGGKETIRNLLKIDPEVKAIISSGYSNDIIMSEYKAYGFSGTVAKPYEIKELSKTLSKVIRG